MTDDAKDTADFLSRLDEIFIISEILEAMTAEMLNQNTKGELP